MATALSNQSIFYYLLRTARTFLLLVLRGVVKEGVPNCPQAQHSGTPNSQSEGSLFNVREGGGGGLLLEQ